MEALPRAFRPFVTMVPIANIVPQLPPRREKRRSRFSRQIISSIREIGLIEPLVVYQQEADRFLLLDGHARLEALKATGATEVRCIIATDDEAFTYNRKVNTIPPIVQHFMFLQALQHGVTEERIAAVLEVDVGVIRRKRDMLNGICDEAIELLRDYKLSAHVFSLMKKMKPLRQVEVAEHMIANSSFSYMFAKALLYGTKPEQLIDPPKERANQNGSDPVANRLSEESDALLRDLKNLEDSFGKDALLLTVCRGYFEKFLSNGKILKYLERHHSESLNALQLWLDNRGLGV